jgi:hypothetical protein
MAKLKAGTTIDGRDVMDEMDDHVNEHIRHTNYAAATGSANNYAVTLSPAPSAYVEGMCVVVKININNTGASTINVNGLGAKSIKKSNGNDVSSGNLKAGSIYTVRYNGTNFILQGEGGEYGTAGATQVLTGYSIGTEMGLVNGTMPNRAGDTAALAISRSGTTIKLRASQGYRDGSDDNVTHTDANDVAANIKKGVTIRGLTGTFTNTSVAPTAGQVLTGKTCWANATQINGSMPNRAGDTAALAISRSGTTLKLLASSGYRDGVDDTVTITDADFLAENIKRGKNIFGLEGTYPAAFTAGDVVLYIDPVRKVTWSDDTYTKVNDITIVFAGTYRVKFELAASTSHSSHPVYGRIYKNGVAVGTERSTSSGTYIEFTEDLTFAAGDNIQLYTKGSPAPAAAFSINFTVATNSNPLYSIVL